MLTIYIIVIGVYLSLIVSLKALNDVFKLEYISSLKYFLGWSLHILSSQWNYTFQLLEDTEFYSLNLNLMLSLVVIVSLPCITFAIHKLSQYVSKWVDETTLIYGEVFILYLDQTPNHILFWAKGCWSKMTYNTLKFSNYIWNDLQLFSISSIQKHYVSKFFLQPWVGCGL